MSISLISTDVGTISALQEHDVFEQLDRKVYKAGAIVAPRLSALKKIVVISSGTIEVCSGGVFGKLVSFLGNRHLLRNGDYLGWQSLSNGQGGVPSAQAPLNSHKATHRMLWQAYAQSDTVCYELDAEIILRKRHSFLKPQLQKNCWCFQSLGAT